MIINEKIWESNIKRSGDLVVCIPFTEKFVIKILEDKHIKSIKNFISFYRTQSIFIRSILPRPIALIKKNKNYFYLEEKVLGKRYTPTFETFPIICKIITNVLTKFTKNKNGSGFVHNDLIYGNIIISKSFPHKIKIIDWNLFGRGYPLIDLLHFCESCFLFLKPNMKYKNRFFEIVLANIELYKRKTGLEETKIKSIIFKVLENKKSLTPFYKFFKKEFN